MRTHSKLFRVLMATVAVLSAGTSIAFASTNHSHRAIAITRCPEIPPDFGCATLFDVSDSLDGTPPVPGPTPPPPHATFTVQLGGGRIQAVAMAPDSHTAYAIVQRIDDQSNLLYKIDALRPPALGTAPPAILVEPGDDEAEFYDITRLRVAPNGVVIALGKRMKRTPLTFLEGIVAFIDFDANRQDTRGIPSGFPSQLMFAPTMNPPSSRWPETKGLLTVTNSNPNARGPHFIYEVDAAAKTLSEFAQVGDIVPDPSWPLLDSSLQEILHLTVQDNVPVFSTRLELHIETSKISRLVSFTGPVETGREALATGHPDSEVLKAVDSAARDRIITLNEETDGPGDIEYRLHDIRLGQRPPDPGFVLELPGDSPDLDKVNGLPDLAAPQTNLNFVQLIRETADGRLGLLARRPTSTMAGPTQIDAPDATGAAPPILHVPPIAILSADPTTTRERVDVIFSLNVVKGTDDIRGIQLSFGDGEVADLIDPRPVPRVRRHKYVSAQTPCPQPDATGCRRPDGTTVYVATLEVTDTGGFEGHASVNITVLLNHPPEIVRSVRRVQVRVGRRQNSLLAVARDADGILGLFAALTGLPNAENQPRFRLKPDPAADPAANRVKISLDRWVPDRSQVGRHRCTLTVKDVSGGSAGVELTVDVKRRDS